MSRCAILTPSDGTGTHTVLSIKGTTAEAIKAAPEVSVLYICPDDWREGIRVRWAQVTENGFTHGALVPTEGA